MTDAHSKSFLDGELESTRWLTVPPVKCLAIGQRRNEWSVVRTRLAFVSTGGGGTAQELAP